MEFEGKDENKDLQIDSVGSSMMTTILRDVTSFVSNEIYLINIFLDGD